MNILNKLNSKQKEAVTAAEGPILILAGAGSGKTRALTHRVAHLVSKGIGPENILAVTFTNKAAEEMRARIAILLKNSKFEIRNSNLFVGTFHSFGLRILRQEIRLLGYGKNFIVYDDDDAQSLAKEIMAELGLSTSQFKPAALLGAVSKAKSELMGFEDFSVQGSGFYQIQVRKFYEAYQRRLKRLNALDFDDLIMLPVKIFEADKNVLEKYQNRFRYILVDEYQDTNRAQYCLINLLAEKFRNLCVIGDPDQSIYTWRGADFRNILNFEKDYPDARIIKLEQNYRSTQNILSAASKIISKNAERKEKTLWTENPPGALIEAVQAPNERREAGFIVNKVRDLNRALGIGLGEMAVFYRTNAQSRAIEEACLVNNLPYRVIGGVKFYQRKEIKDVLAYLRLIQNPNDELSQKRITDVLGKRKFADFWNGRSELKAELLFPADLIKAVIKKTGYYDYLRQKFPSLTSEGEPEAESRIKNLKELTGLAKKYDIELNASEALSRFLSEVALMQDLDRHDSSVQKLNLMTLHSAKGLEFEAVFIAGLEEGLLPHSRANHSKNDFEEERRLCYVGLTRAKNYLWLLFAARRNIWGESGETVPSRFLAELPPQLINFSFADYDGDGPEIILE